MEGSFLQSSQWQEFQEKVGRQTFRIDSWLFIRVALPFSRSYLYCPRCDFDNKTAERVKKILEGIDEIKVKEDIFVRIEPTADSRQLAARFYQAPAMQPQTTLILDLNQTDDELLAAMKPKTRYNIHLAERQEIKIRNSKFEIRNSDFNEFWQLATETARRDHFSLHPKSYYQTMLEVLGEKDSAHLLLAYHQKDLLAGMILITYNDLAVYLHGASSSLKRNLMAPYLLQWEAIKFARSQGCTSYDFWGIRKTEDGGQKTEDGVTRFKLGFGGQIIHYPGCFELPLRKVEYYGYRVLRKIDRFFKSRTFG